MFWAEEVGRSFCEGVRGRHNVGRWGGVWESLGRRRLT